MNIEAYNKLKSDLGTNDEAKKILFGLVGDNDMYINKDGISENFFQKK